MVLPISWDIDVRLKSKMAAKLPEVQITAGFTVVPKTIQVLVTIYETVHSLYETSKCPAIMADPTLPRAENPRWQSTNRK